MARWGGLAQCDKCPHRRACDYRLPLGQAPNPLCPDGWVEGPVPAHMIPGSGYKPVSNEGKYTGTLRREKDRIAQYSKRKFCLMCACWDKKHTRVTNNSRTWLCTRHLRVFQAWKRKHNLPPIPIRPATVAKRKQVTKDRAIFAALTDGGRSLREVATALDCSVESARFHLNRLARVHKVGRVPLRRGRARIAWQLIAKEQ